MDLEKLKAVVEHLVRRLGNEIDSDKKPTTVVETVQDLLAAIPQEIKSSDELAEQLMNIATICVWGVASQLEEKPVPSATDAENAVARILDKTKDFKMIS